MGITKRFYAAKKGAMLLLLFVFMGGHLFAATDESAVPATTADSAVSTTSIETAAAAAGSSATTHASKAKQIKRHAANAIVIPAVKTGSAIPAGGVATYSATDDSVVPATSADSEPPVIPFEATAAVAKPAKTAKTIKPAEETKTTDAKAKAAEEAKAQAAKATEEAKAAKAAEEAKTKAAKATEEAKAAKAAEEAKAKAAKATEEAKAAKAAEEAKAKAAKAAEEAKAAKAAEEAKAKAAKAAEEAKAAKAAEEAKAKAAKVAEETKAAKAAEEAKAKAAKSTESVVLDTLAGGSNELSLTLKALGAPGTIKLAGTESQHSVSFSFHTLDVVSKLQVRLKYAHAAKLLPESSSLKIILNEQEVGSIPLLPENADKELESTVAIDPLLLQEWNNLSIKLMAHMEGQCDDPRSPAIWLSINHIQSAIEATTVTLPLANDLEFFPMPFFDRHDSRNLSLPFVFSSKPSWEALKSAGIMASWFGRAAEWRKSQFPAYLNSIPELDAIVFATSQDRIEGIELPQVTEGLANISLVNNPRNPNARLLLVVGRDDHGLVEAAKAITLGKVVLDGTSVNVLEAAATLPRKPFDAPLWIDPNKVVRLVDLVPSDQLKRSALLIAPLQFKLSLPPNLYKGETTTIPFDFIFEASNINGRYLSKIEASINGIPFHTASFGYVNETAKHGKVRFNIPMRHITGKDTVTLKFLFEQNGTRKCGAEVANDEIRIDPKSTIDLTSIPRYMELPDLSQLAYTGFPYSRQADLSETAVLLPEQPDSFEIEAMLTALGHIGNKTGYPATALTIASVGDAQRLAGKDLLVIGATERISPLLSEWKRSMPVNLLAGTQPWPFWGERFFDRWSERIILSAKLKQDKERKVMVMAGMRSPLDSDRSVVVLAADSLPDLSVGASALNTFYKAKNFRGDIAVIGSDGLVMPFNHRMHHYSIGWLPIMEYARRAVWHSPWLAILCASIYSLFFAAIIFRKLKKHADDKLK